MKKLLVVTLITLVFTQFTAAQNFIGLHKNQIKQVMRESNRRLHLDNSTVNKTYNYLKYVDSMGSQTLLFFLDDNDKCKLVRHMCDYSMLDDKRAELDNKFTKKSDNLYVYRHEQKNFEVKIKEGEWYFTVTTRPK